MVLVSGKRHLLVWWGIFLLGLSPLAWLIYRIFLNDLGTDPVSTVVKINGEWAIRFLWLTLFVTPLRVWFRWRWLVKYRRMFGLYALFYASTHLLAFIALMLEWQWSQIYEEFLERPYISMGAAGYLLMLALGVTSFKSAMKYMGRNWARLHRLVYVIAILVLVHYYWQIRSDYGEVLIYTGVLGLLFLARVLNPISRGDFRTDSR
ncbi:sulfite oxidase heme-binding subunit YedZ [Motiliproteus sp. MSK22-1]|uniref:sulfite oxidase heme-binding subunit YedZ n=1 Tax=Motiliproteus sp. MSK22-1 TaxID=1897630 RepID=UPI000975E7E7|nr:protein-methionine-sulfoxide reductase heme-binding subunit MsrQ [Motiliproteus sp. MSK22-1]OMH38663.1 hypothetical protein BGP75_06370 [Motiliproteus sp. MSK22-1]